MSEKIKLAISTCLLGEPVRYNGGHKLERFLWDTLGQYVEYLPICPEVECGLDTPREPFLNHYVRKYNQQYLMQQYYLNPHPLELKLRTHV